MVQAILATPGDEDGLIVDLRHAKELDKEVRKRLLDRAIKREIDPYEAARTLMQSGMLTQ